MSSGNANASVPSGGKESDKEPDPGCVELEQANNDRRKQLKPYKDRRLVGEDREGQGTTVTSSKMSMTSGSTLSPGAHNSNLAHKRLSQTFSPGASMTDRYEGKSGLHCPPADPYLHPGPSVQKSGHAEARLMDQYAPQGLNAVTFNIDWHPGNLQDPPSKMPCPSCHRMLCYAQQNCKIEIHLCKNDRTTEALSEYCPANSDSYINLQQQMK